MKMKTNSYDNRQLALNQEHLFQKWTYDKTAKIKLRSTFSFIIEMSEHNEQLNLKILELDII